MCTADITKKQSQALSWVTHGRAVDTAQLHGKVHSMLCHSSLVQAVQQSGLPQGDEHSTSQQHTQHTHQSHTKLSK